MSTAVQTAPQIPLPSPVVVDLTDDTEPPAPPARRRRTNSGRAVPIPIGAPSSGPREIITIDSDDEDLPGPSATSRRPRRLRSPPAPRASTSAIPPVPAVPQGVILPFANPFINAINDRLTSLRRGIFAPTAPAASAAPAAPRRAARTGLGGALLARLDTSAAERAALEAYRRQHADARHRAALALMGIDDYPDDAPEGLLDRDPALARPFRSFGAAMHTRVIHPPRPDYLPTYTHAAEPAPGFTCDFDVAAPEDAGARVEVRDERGELEIEEVRPDTSTRTELVCARCSEPLLWGGEGARRLWALRCGHLLDAQCVDALAAKPTPADAEPELEPEPAVDVKGKGKAKAELEPAGNSMRSRLRARPAAAPPAAKKRASILKKGKGRAPPPALKLDEHVWACPVGGCARAHVMDLMKGGAGHEDETRWVHRAGEGPIAIFA